MIHYHGLPITPESVVAQAMHGAHFLVSFANPSQAPVAFEVCSSFMLDNGAFPLWRSGNSQHEWGGYYEWVRGLSRLPAFDFAIIPDVIDGDEAANDALLAEWPFPLHIGAPVWHLHESLSRLESLCATYPRVCLGSSGAYSMPGSAIWWTRIEEAMRFACDADGYPRTQLHGLRMLHPRIIERMPFKSADSTNLARNIGIDSRWSGAYQPPSKAARAAILRSRIEHLHCPERYRFACRTRTRL